jgi:hypothetical protein
MTTTPEAMRALGVALENAAAAFYKVAAQLESLTPVAETPKPRGRKAKPLDPEENPNQAEDIRSESLAAEDEFVSEIGKAKAEFTESTAPTVDELRDLLTTTSKRVGRDKVLPLLEGKHLNDFSADERVALRDKVQAL